MFMSNYAKGRQIKIDERLKHISPEGYIEMFIMEKDGGVTRWGSLKGELAQVIHELAFSFWRDSSRNHHCAKFIINNRHKNLPFTFISENNLLIFNRVTVSKNHKKKIEEISRKEWVDPIDLSEYLEEVFIYLFLESDREEKEEWIASAEHYDHLP